MGSAELSMHSYGCNRSDVTEFLIECGVNKTEKESGLPKLLAGPIKLADATRLAVGDEVEDRANGALGKIIEIRSYWDRPGPYVYVDYGSDLKREQAPSYVKKIG